MGKKATDTDKSMVRFPNLTQNVRQLIGDRLIEQLWESYYAAETQVKEDKWEGAQQKIDDRIGEIVELAQDERNRINSIFCNLRAFKPDFYTGCTSRGRRGVTESMLTEYDPTTAICKMTRKRYN